VTPSVAVFEAAKINVYDQIMIENKKKRENTEIREFFT